MSELLDHPRVVRTLRSLGWRLIVPLLRMRSRRRLGSLTPGEVTVVTVSWNSWEYLAVLLDVVRRRSPAGTRILVVDNGSKRWVQAAFG